MKRVQVLLPFRNVDTNEVHVAGDVIEVSEEKLAKIRAVNVNMVLVLADVEPTEEVKKPRTKKSKTTK